MNLKNKKILFVDDLSDSIEIHVKRLREDHQAEVIINRTIDQAVETLSKQYIDFVVIDLYIPRGFNEVKQYEESTDVPKMNQGELFAHYIKEHYKNTPFLYLTSQQSFYKGQENNLLFNKSGQQIDTVIKKIDELINMSPTKNQDE